MTRQEIFDIVARHLLAQGKRAQYDPEIPGSSCTLRECHRADSTVKCAVGALIPDALYTPAMEGYVGTLASDYPQLAPYLLASDVAPWIAANDLNCLRQIHDHGRTGYWRDELARYARDRELDATVIGATPVPA